MHDGSKYDFLLFIKKSWSVRIIILQSLSKFANNDVSLFIFNLVVTGADPNIEFWCGKNMKEFMN